MVLEVPAHMAVQVSVGIWNSDKTFFTFDSLSVGTRLCTVVGDLVDLLNGITNS